MQNYSARLHNENLADGLLSEIESLSSELSVKNKRPIKLIAVGNNQTLSIFEHKIATNLPKTLELVQGYGHPAWFLPMDCIDKAITISNLDELIFATFGDALTIPGSSQESLKEALSQGADIRVIDSPMEALVIAQSNPKKQVVFFGVGFEDTAADTALMILQAATNGIENLSVLCNHVTILPAIKSILDSPSEEIDGFIVPSDISAVIGMQPYRFIAENYCKPFVIADSKPVDIIKAIWMLLQQLVRNYTEVENLDNEKVLTGSPELQKTLVQVFSLRKYFEWRGLGSINYSGLQIRPEYSKFDAEIKFGLPKLKIADPSSCQCGEVIKGAKKSHECKVFGTSCTPQTPIGAFMVSELGSCASEYYKQKLAAVKVVG
jgi:hydrogenase expression/formation protein HypD